MRRFRLRKHNYHKYISLSDNPNYRHAIVYVNSIIPHNFSYIEITCKDGESCNLFYLPPIHLLRSDDPDYTYLSTWKSLHNHQITITYIDDKHLSNHRLIYRINGHYIKHLWFYKKYNHLIVDIKQQINTLMQTGKKKKLLRTY